MRDLALFVSALVTACGGPPPPPRRLAPVEAVTVREARPALRTRASTPPREQRVSVHDAPAWDELDRERRAAVRLLFGARQLESSHLSDDAHASRLNQAMQELAVRRPRTDLLHWLAVNASPPGRVYAVIGLRQARDPRALEVWDEVVAEIGEQPLPLVVGCSVQFESAASLLNGGWARAQFERSPRPAASSPTYFAGEAMVRRYTAFRLRDRRGRPVVADSVSTAPRRTCVTRGRWRRCFGQGREVRVHDTTEPCAIEGGRLACRRPSPLAPGGISRWVEGPEDVVELLRLAGLHFVARDRSGRVWTFRVDEEGRTQDLAATAIDDVVDVFPLQFDEACARRRGGEVRCFGPRAPATSPDDDAMVVRGLPPLTHIADGHGHTCGRTARGAVYCWGARGAHVNVPDP